MIADTNRSISTLFQFLKMNIQTLTAAFLLVFALFWTACQGDQNGSWVTVNPKGEMTAFGQPVSTFEQLKSVLVDSLAKMSAIPEKIDIRFDGEVGMGARQEVETIAEEAIAAAKLLKNAPKIEILSYRKEQGTDCDKPDSLRTFCASIDVQYPSVVRGEKALQDSVGKWTDRYLFSMLEGSWEEPVKAKTLDEAAAAFFKNHQESKGSAAGAGFVAMSGSEVVYNDGKYLTLAINGYTFQGGAHGLPTEALNTFDAQTGKIYRWDELVTDKAALLALAEKKVRETRADVFAEGFNFDETFVFVLPANYGLTKEGLFLYYVPYEIMPYAMGETEVLLTFEELGNLSKIRL